MKHKNDSSFFKIFRFMSYVAKLRPQLPAWLFVNTLFGAASVMITVYIPKILIDLFTEGEGREERLWIFLLLLGIKLVIYYGTDLMEYRIKTETALLDTKVSMALSQKVNHMKYAYLESPEILELKEKARMPIQMGTIFDVSEVIKDFFQAIFTLTGLTWILIRFSLPVFLAVTLFSVISIFVEYKFSKLLIKFMQETVSLNRKYNYFSDILMGDRNQKEFRTYGTDKLVNEKIRVFNHQLWNCVSEIRRKQAKGVCLSGLFDTLSKFLVYGYAGLRVLGIFGAKIRLGDFSVWIGAGETYFQTLTKLGGNIFSLITRIPMIEPIFTFLELPEMKDQADAGESEEFYSLTFENVSFSYPDTNKKILDDLSFTIQKGETVALVGINNSGKTTIVKLICRLFEPTEGRILWNGKDIRNIKYKEYLKELSTVFQDFKLFPISIAENLLANVKEEGGSLTEEEKESLSTILREVELERVIKALPQGMDSKLNKSLFADGVELSGGEKQKLAIARAVYGTSSFAILDEPTAALDPLAEAEVYGHFSNLVKNKTAIFISHRMSASRFSDRILVLENGKITGNGSHKELIETNDLYRSLYEAQAQYYK